LLSSPALFPFDILLSSKPISDINPRIALYRQGRNEELVSLQPHENRQLQPSERAGLINEY